MTFWYPDAHFDVKNGHMSSFKIMRLTYDSAMRKAMSFKFHTKIDSGLFLSLEQKYTLLGQTLTVSNTEKIITKCQILMYKTAVYTRANGNIQKTSKNSKNHQRRHYFYSNVDKVLLK